MNTESLDLLKILRLLLRRAWLIIIIALLSLSATGIFTYFMLDEQYSANALLYIWNDRKETDTGYNSGVQAADLAVFTALVADYQVLAKSRYVTNKVIAELQLDPVAAAGLSGKISVGTKNNTRHLTITVIDTDPAFAALVANKTAEVFAASVIEKMGVDNVQIIDPAVAPGGPSSPNKPRNLALGLLVGLAAGIGLVLLIDMLDTRVKNSDDVESITGFTLLGAIPEFAKDTSEYEGRRR